MKTIANEQSIIDTIKGNAEVAKEYHGTSSVVLIIPASMAKYYAAVYKRHYSVSDERLPPLYADHHCESDGYVVAKMFLKTRPGNAMRAFKVRF